MTAVSEQEPFSPVGRWKTADSFAMRRILTIYEVDGSIAAFRPFIQQCRGTKRKNHSTVFRVTEQMPEPIARAKAQSWRDRKETDLGLFGGATSVKATLPASIGLYLVVTHSIPARVLWSSRRLSSGRRIRVYVGKKLSYQVAYETALARVASELGLPLPTSYPQAPAPTQEQLDHILEIGIEIAPRAS